MNSANIQRVDSLGNQVYEHLKEAIISASLLPNEILTEEKLAKELGISRTPLREAFNKLAQEGLIDIQKGKPAKVATFTTKDALEFMELRRLLESYNLETISSNITDEFIQELRQNSHKQKWSVQGDHFREFIELDREFHIMLASNNYNKKLQQVIYELNIGVSRSFLILSNTLHMSAKEAYKEHSEIIDALEKEDIPLAKAKLLEHLLQVERRFLSYQNMGEIK